MRKTMSAAQMPSSGGAVSRKQVQRRRKKPNTARSIFFAFFVALALLIALLSVFFKIENVEIFGLRKYPPQLVKDSVSYVVGKNLYGINYDSIQDKLIKEFPYVKSVRIKQKHFPPSLSIYITEYSPEGAILNDNIATLITRTGKILEQGIIFPPSDVIMITGIDVDGYLPGDVLGAKAPPDPKKILSPPSIPTNLNLNTAETAEKISMFAELLDAIAESKFTQITNVSLDDTLNMKIIYENRIIIELGVESKLTQKLLLSKQILENNIDSHAEGTLILEIDRKRARFVPKNTENFADSKLFSD